MPTIRLYKQHRYDEYYHIRRQVFTVEQQIDPSIELDEYDSLDREDVIHFAYWHSKQLIASARVILLADKEILVGRIATLKEFRNKGYGTQLLRDIEVYFHNIGYEGSYSLTIECRPHSMRRTGTDPRVIPLSRLTLNTS